MDDRSTKLPKQRRWFRFSLRALLLVFTAVCVVLGWKVNLAVQQREGVAAVRELGGALAYDYQRYRGELRANTPQGTPPGPQWLRDQIGVDFFADVIQVDCQNTKIRDTEMIGKLRRLQWLNLNTTDVRDLSPLANLGRLHTLECRDTYVSSISALRGLTDLRFLQLNGTDVKELTPLAGLFNLEELYLAGTSVENVSPLANLRNLKFVGLRGTSVQDVEPLSNLSNLKWLDLRDTLVEKDDIQSLERALPDCNVEFSRR